MVTGASIPTSTLLFTLLAEPARRTGGVTEYTSPARGTVTFTTGWVTLGPVLTFTVIPRGNIHLHLHLVLGAAYVV